ncbi:MAG TPA: NAD(P)H-dependent oxidoreductase subunit E [bacterium]|nr:NAD(P)H-dependent oxidoreductase subunit E [bacterium]
MGLEINKVDPILEKYGSQKSALIQILMDVQAVFKYLPREVLDYISEKLNVPMSTIYNVATFYKAFSLEPKGEHVCSVCMGTACHVRGAPVILDSISRRLDLPPDKTSADRKWTLETVNCLGSCALGPLVVVDGVYHGKATSAKIGKVIDKLSKDEG